MNDKVNLADKLDRVSKPWTPTIIGELNGQHVKVAKLDGEFVWHRHEEVDELFMVLRGRIRILFRDREVTLDEGELYIVPRGVEHKPVADAPAEVLLFEPAGTRNTGDVVDEVLTIDPEDLPRA